LPVSSHLLTGERRVLIVRADPRDASELDRCSVGAVLTDADSDALASLVLPMEATTGVRTQLFAAAV
jgi:hypothetical protein